MIDTLTETLRFIPPKAHARARRLSVAILVVAPFLFGLLALYLGQDANWDLRNYHWYNAYAFLNGRYETDLLPSQTPWFYNPAMDVPFYLMATHWPARLTGFVLGTVQGLNFVLLFMLAHAALVVPNPRHKVLVCGLLAAMGMLGGGGIALIGTTFYDNVTSLGLFASALLTIRFNKQHAGASWGRGLLLAVLCGFPAGVVMGLKLPCFTFVGALGLAVLLSTPGWRRLSVSAGFGIGILAGLALSFGYWAWFLQTHFGSPMFPYFNEVFKSPLAPLSSARDTQYVQRSLHDLLLFPFIFTDSPFRTGEIPFRDLRIPILYVLLPAAVALRLVFGRNRNDLTRFAEPQVARYILWLSVFAYAAWLVMFGIYRYLVPLEMLAPLLIVLAVGYLPLKQAPRAMLAAFLLVVIAVTLQPGNWSRRGEWLDHFMSSEIPELGPVSDTMLLMAGFEPYSHMVAQMPPEMPVVRIQSNFASPDQGKPINTVVQQRLNAHKGRFLLLIPDWQHKAADEALGYFQLAAHWNTCQTVKDHLYDGTYDLCPVTRTTGKP